MYYMQISLLILVQIFSADVTDCIAMYKMHSENLQQICDT